MDTHIERAQRFAAFRNRPLMTLMLGHLMIDMHGGLLPVFYPLLISRFGLDLKTVGLVALAYTGVASLVQPLFGWIADRYGTRYIGLALIWTSATFATIGFAGSFPLLLILAGAAGVGSGAYHPFGALNANAVIPAPQRNTAMSIYVTGGTVGVALGPLIGALVFGLFGTHGTVLMLLPGATIAIWLLFQAPIFAQRRRAPAAPGAKAPAPVPLIPLLAVIGVMGSRSWTVASLQAFLPTWYKSLGYSAAFYGPLATTLVLSSALGTIGCGSLADRFGRRAVTIGTLILTIPAVLMLAQFTGPIAFVIVALVGFSAASTAPLMLVTAQQLMAGRPGVASGLILGLGFVTSAVGVPVTGALADAYGMPAAIRSQVILVLATIALAWLLPSEARLRKLEEPRS
ncbi:MAG TPA: MFS transporter [Roseiflexaceae bacterium]|nr:MFS transporter [Roseiflexaceae bacterium]